MGKDRQQPQKTNVVQLTPEQKARAAARRKRRMRRRVLRTVLVLTVLLILALVIALVVLMISGKVAQKNGEPASFLAVKEILVEGETRYSPQDIIDASHMYIGESLLVVNKVQAHNAILEKFPYLDQVEVSNSAFSTIVIRVSETPVMGAVQMGDEWMLLGANNHALERVMADAVPEEAVEITGATLVGVELGQPLLDDRSLRVTKTLLDAAKAHGLDGLTRVDLAAKTDIHIHWKDQIDVKLGNESNLEAQVQALQKLLPTLLGNNGEGVTGKLDMSSYADDDSTNDRAIFSPTEK